MRKLTLESEFPITIEKIDDTEKKLDIIFPRIYKEFLLTNNGHHLLECNFEKEENWILSINFLYSISDSKECSLLHIAEMYYENFMSKNFLPIGDDGDWIFVISLRDIDYEYIYIYKTDDVEDDCLVFLSNSLENFVNSLFPNKRSV